MENAFVMFGRNHLAALAVIVFLSATGPQLIRRLATDVFERNFRYALAALIWGQEIILYIYRISNDIWTVQENLSLHLCGMSIIVLPVMLIRKNYFLYELTYFWGLAGATQALLTPNTTVDFPHFLFLQFFLSHGIIIFAVIYATVIFGFRPTAKSGVKAFFITLFLLLPIGVINWLIKSNYFFIAHKPDSASVLDIMGPWPWYLLGMIGMGALMFTVVYLPSAFLRKSAFGAETERLEKASDAQVAD